MTTLYKGNREMHFFQDDEGRCFVSNKGFGHWTETTKEEGNRWFLEALANGWKRSKMQTADIFTEVYRARTTGRKRVFTVENLTLGAVKLVLDGEMVDLDTAGAKADAEAGFLKRKNCSGFYGGHDGYVLTAKGFRRILVELS